MYFENVAIFWLQRKYVIKAINNNNECIKKIEVKK